ncbi:MAG TPA: hypothetical protein VKU02_28420 [Gemmataceae bacterium]|nr:hypothetical protein [Gemmataceae bacterium]
MTQQAGTQKLWLRVIGFSSADLVVFVADVWPLAQENPDVTYRAQGFLESGQGEVPNWLKHPVRR